MIHAARKGSNERGTRAPRESEQQMDYCNNIGRPPRRAEAPVKPTPAIETVTSGNSFE